MESRCKLSLYSYNSGDKLDADIVVVSAGPCGGAAEDSFDDIQHSLVGTVGGKVNPRSDGTMYIRMYG